MSALAGRDREKCHRYIRATLKTNDHRNRRKRAKMRLSKRMMRITGFSRARLTRLTGHHRRTRKIVDRRRVVRVTR